MRTPEEVAREIECQPSSGRCLTHEREWPCNDSAVRYIAAAIRERDAEVLAEVEQLTQSLEAAYYALTGGLSARSDSDAWKKSQFARDILRDALDRP